MNETSITASVGVYGISPGVRYLALQFSSDVTLSSASNELTSCAVPESIATTCFAPCLSKQSVKPPLEAPISIASLPSQLTPKASIAASSLSPPRLTYFFELLSTATVFGGTSNEYAGFFITLPSTVTAPARINPFASVRLAASPISQR